MKYFLFSLLFVIVLSAIPVIAQTAGTGSNVTLTLPRTPEQTDNVTLQVKIGNFTKGTELEIWTVEGRFLGAISPFGNASRDPKDTAIYSVPIPLDAIKDKRLELRLVINTANNLERAPTKKDVRSAKLKITSNANTRP